MRGCCHRASSAVGPPYRGTPSKLWRVAQVSDILRQSPSEGAPGPRFWDLGGFCGELDGDAPRPLSIPALEKLRYMHRNPAVRGLVEKPEHWPWSSYRHSLTGATGAVEIESEWTAARRGGRLPKGFELKTPGG